MKTINFKKEIVSSQEEAVRKIESALKPVGFGLLTRIDFDKKIKEKINKDISPTIILGFCNPGLAYEAFIRKPDVTSLIPCNVVVRELGAGKVSIEVAKPTIMMEILGDTELVKMAQEADAILEKALFSIS